MALLLPNRSYLSMKYSIEYRKLTFLLHLPQTPSTQDSFPSSLPVITGEWATAQHNPSPALDPLQAPPAITSTRHASLVDVSSSALPPPSLHPCPTLVFSFSLRPSPSLGSSATPDTRNSPTVLKQIIALCLFSHSHPHPCWGACCPRQRRGGDEQGDRCTYTRYNCSPCHPVGNLTCHNHLNRKFFLPKMDSATHSPLTVFHTYIYWVF